MFLSRGEQSRVSGVGGMRGRRSGGKREEVEGKGREVEERKGRKKGKRKGYCVTELLVGSYL